MPPCRVVGNSGCAKVFVQLPRRSHRRRNSEQAAPAAPKTVTEEVITSAHVSLGSAASIDLDGTNLTLTRDGETVSLKLDHVADTVTVEGRFPTGSSSVRKVVASSPISAWPAGSTSQPSGCGCASASSAGKTSSSTPTRLLRSHAVSGAAQDYVGERIDPNMSNLALAWKQRSL